MKDVATALSRIAVVPVFFAVKVGSAIILLAASTAWLTVAEFAEFTQLLILASLLNLLAVGGVQNGIIGIAAGSPSSASLARSRNAALLLWATIALLGVLVALVGAGQISTLLVGDDRAAFAVAVVILLTLLGGPGQVLTSILSGIRRTAASLMAQGLGLAAATVGALAMLHRGDVQLAAMAFSIAPVITMAVSWLMMKREHLPTGSFRGLAKEVRELIGFSSASVALAGFSAAVLFGLRFAYQKTFGLAALGHWLAANRISDTTTQFLGLVLMQLFLPRYAQLTADQSGNKLQLQAWAAGTAMMTSILLIFIAAPGLWVRLLLSPAYVPAIQGIVLYMLGDTLRVWAAVAMNAQLARGRPWLFAGIEIATLSIMAVVTLILMAGGYPLAPMQGYLAAYAITAAIVTAQYFRAMWRAPQ